MVCGLVSIPLSNSVYYFEDLFGKLPVHWMWWPAIGGIVVGVGGLVFPQALGVGYDVIGELVKGDRALHLVLGVLIVKWLIWSVALGSGTSGGVLAPVMMIGAGLGALMSYGLPDMGPGFWAMIGLGRDAKRNVARADDGDCIHGGTDARLEHAAAAAAGVRGIVHGFDGFAAAVDPDGKGGATGLPREQRICDRSAWSCCTRAR